MVVFRSCVGSIEHPLYASWYLTVTIRPTDMAEGDAQVSVTTTHPPGRWRSAAIISEQRADRTRSTRRA